MQGAENCQGDGETQIAQGYDLVEAAGPREIGLGSPQGNQEKQDSGAAHRDRGAGNLKKRGEDDWVHVDGKSQVACYISGACSGSIRLQIVQRGEDIPPVV
jgi:hypothetical protein